MEEKFIPVADLRLQKAPVIPDVLEAPTGLLSDSLARPLQDLRISVTDRCNFRCVYCMPKEVFDKDYAFLPHSALLTFEEITRIARLFIDFQTVVVRDGIDPQVAHRAFLAIDEYRFRIAPDTEGAEFEDPPEED